MINRLERRVALESAGAVARYETLKRVGKESFADSDVVGRGVVTKKDVRTAKKFLAEGTRETSPLCWASLFEHYLIAPEMAKRIAERIARSEKAKEKGIVVDPTLVEFNTFLHDPGRLVIPGAYLRNDYIGDRLFVEMGIPKEVIGNLSSTRRLIEAAEKLEIKKGDIPYITQQIGVKNWEEILSPEQMKVARGYFESLTPIRRVINLADNLGKRDEEGLFDFEKFIKYLKSQEGRYSTRETGWPSSDWTIKAKKGKEDEVSRREAGAILQAFVVDKTIRWLKDLGVDFSNILEEMKDYGPRFVVVVRHGELDNPSGKVYNRDAVMRPEEVVYLSDEGKEQMVIVGNLLKKRGFRGAELFYSPEERTKEATDALNSVLRITRVKEVGGLDDVYAPGPVLEGMTMEELRNVGGNVYTDERWKKYNHERPAEVVERMHGAFRSMVKSLKVGETGILVSHGDPIAFLLNFLVSKKVADPQNLRKMIYPGKGEAAVVIIDPKGRFFSLYLLTDPSLKKGDIY